MKKLFLFLIFFVLFFSPKISSATEGLFYFFDNAYGLSDFNSNYKEMDIIAPQVYEVGYDLKISKPTYKKILTDAKKKDVSTMPLIVNDDFSRSLMNDLLLDPQAQDKIIEFMIKEAKARKFIGWQFDFENINHWVRDLYTDFVKKTYIKMKENNLQFSVAVSVRARPYDPEDENQDWSSAYDYAQLAENSDFLSLMTYDDPRSVGPVASMPYLEKTLDYLLTQAPAEKMSLGVPFYCWQWQDGERTNATTFRLANKNYKKGSERKKGFDKELGAYFFKFKKNNIENTIWCDDSQTFSNKLDLIEKKGLRGFSAWALGQEDEDIWDILEDRK